MKPLSKDEIWYVRKYLEELRKIWYEQERTLFGCYGDLWKILSTEQRKELKKITKENFRTGYLDKIIEKLRKLQ